MKRATFLLFVMVAGRTPQHSASFMPMTSLGTSLSTHAANLYFQQEWMQQQSDLLRQQQQQRSQYLNE